MNFSLWLNEGFARFMQNIGADHVQGSKSGILDRFVTTSTLVAMDMGMTPLSISRNTILIQNMQDPRCFKFWPFFLTYPKNVEGF